LYDTVVYGAAVGVLFCLQARKTAYNGSASAIESELLQLNKNAYGIRLYLEREKVVVACTKKQINSIFIQSAYATICDCPPEFLYFANDSIVSIKIFTVNNFDNQHLENSDVTDYFKVAGSFSTIESYVANMYYTLSDGRILKQQTLEIELL